MYLCCMDFPFNINSILRDNITVIQKQHLTSAREPLNSSHTKDAEKKTNLIKIIDQMGLASCKAQGLHGPITSASKLQASDHSLYLLKDSDANQGCGALVGILRTGFKRLFVVDIQGQQHECHPHCVLDFYVHESRQRSGCGKALFDFMLQHKNIDPKHLAIDRPSSKFISFLRKHYGLRNTVAQMNNFCVFDGFFDDLAAIGAVNANRRSSAPGYRGPLCRMKQHPPSSRKALSATVAGERRFCGSNIEVSNDGVDPARGGATERRTPALLLHSRPNLHESILDALNPRAFGSENLNQVFPARSGGTASGGLSSFSRHEVAVGRFREKSSNSNVNELPLPPDIKPAFSQPRIHSQKTSTSSENPLHRIPSSKSPLKVSPVLDENGNYTVSGVCQQLRLPPVLGTGWNVLGVPGGPGTYFQHLKRFPR